MSRPAAIYARVSSDRQKENHTIASQTAALKEYSHAHDYLVPAEWVFEDEGYSGATLVRPGLEALRDLAAQGEIEAVLVYSPDRLSRKYAYQVVLAEELSRCGVALVFLQAPSGETAEDRLLVQFQGMIAEYERAQILERYRRGKRHKAQIGVVSVLSGAPYGYRYFKKSDTAEACYQVIEHEADVVRMVFDAYTREGLSINAIARLLNQRQIATRHGDTRWERSTVWGLLRNPAYRGRACYGKTELRARNGSPVHSDSVTDCPHATAQATSGRARTGSRLRFQHWSVTRRSSWHKSNWKETAATLRGAPANRPCYRGCWYAGNAVTLCIALRRGHPNENSITIAASGPTPTGICAARCATTARCGRITWMSSCGARSSDCRKIALWSKPRSIGAWKRHETRIPCAIANSICANNRLDCKMESSGC
jgi:DNA invertase Pin-like site-specific DNA recombinase